MNVIPENRKRSFTQYSQGQSSVGCEMLSHQVAAQRPRTSPPAQHMKVEPDDMEMDVQQCTEERKHAAPKSMSSSSDDDEYGQEWSTFRQWDDEQGEGGCEIDVSCNLMFASPS